MRNTRLMTGFIALLVGLGVINTAKATVYYTFINQGDLAVNFTVSAAQFTPIVNLTSNNCQFTSVSDFTCSAISFLSDTSGYDLYGLDNFDAVSVSYQIQNNRGRSNFFFPNGALQAYGTYDGVFDGSRLIVAPSIPEPATWALLIAGIGLVGTALRRGRRGAPWVGTGLRRRTRRLTAIPA